MKPTQEQIIAWAKEAGAYCHYGDFNMGHSYELQPDQLERFAILAYEAGRKDENEACDAIAVWILKMPENDVSAAIRARREQ